MSENRYNFKDLKLLMSRLRDPETGCPWDIRQSYRSIVPHTLEEVYEVIDTIEREDYEHLSEELGDLLFQVVFYAQIASDEDRFSLDDIIHQLVSKLIYRHPHVFPDGSLHGGSATQMTEADIQHQWEELKQQEKQSGKVLDDVPNALPGMLRAKKLQKKAAKVGFDWPDVSHVIDKAYEELAELKEAIAEGNPQEIEAELGDLLFVLANVARHTKVDPEQAVRSTNKKFERRFGHVEQSVVQSGKGWNEYSLEALDAFWNEAKQLERSVK
ncbi:nucleoside triphosphate pyrophosphohydrolase [Reinekea marinisedimentorum]|uniref:Nucleoside triphosphate pyrophosphohydrolase n=1 Tax=Reinekea marinisedimentorum TaxID=230495 RepID=A0A4R3I238_9GAMM|nr:nucleoside triphosphate pyrophosphohydrolase [Reinekea marinisedimentorum]TCS39817.1 ATP diphosphatase [Reinekea marinisedimentorum]